jgi:hypothetical protein
MTVSPAAAVLAMPEEAPVTSATGVAAVVIVDSSPSSWTSSGIGSSDARRRIVPVSVTLLDTAGDAASDGGACRPDDDVDDRIRLGPPCTMRALPAAALEVRG